MANIIGTSGDDNLLGTFRSDLIKGYGGNDSITDRRDGNDSIYGGAGDDLLQVSRSGEATSAVLANGGSGDDDLFMQFNSHTNATLIGGAGNDILELYGAAAAKLIAGSGNDRVFLGDFSGQVRVGLGAGADQVVVLGSTNVGAIKISDFAAAAGDQLNVTDWLVEHLVGWDSDTDPFRDGYLRLVQRGSATLLEVDVNAGDGSWQTLTKLSGVSADDLTDFNLGGNGWDVHAGEVTTPTHGDVALIV